MGNSLILQRIEYLRLVCKSKFGKTVLQKQKLALGNLRHAGTVDLKA